MESSTRNPAIFEAVEQNDERAVKYHVEENLIPITSTNWHDQTIAHVAAKKGNLNIIKYVLEKDPSLLKIKDFFGDTVFSLSIEYGHVDIVKYLVEERKVQILQPFVQFFGCPTAIHLAAQKGQLNVLKYFIEEKKGDVNVLTEEYKETPAFSAARHKHHHIIKYLFEERNADPTTTDYKGDNILYMIVKENDLGLMKYVLDERKVDLDINWRNKYGRTLLHLAAFFNRLDFLKYLVEEKHADVNIPDSKNRTPLHRAAHFNHYESCEYLVQHGANIQLEDRDGKLPIDEAMHDRLVELLKEASSKRNRRSMPVSMVVMSQPKMTGRLPSSISCLGGGMSSLNATISSSQVQNFLVVGQMILKYAKRSRYHGSHRSSFSPRGIVGARIDAMAINAVHTPPHVRE